MLSNNNEKDEKELVRRAKAGDTSAFEKLYNLYRGRIYGLCLRMTRNPADAEDCRQETMVRAWMKLKTFRGKSKFSTWLYRVAVNTTKNYLRKKRPMPTGSDVDTSTGVVIRSKRKVPLDVAAALEECLDTLNDREREVLLLDTAVELDFEGLKDCEERTQSEIGNVMGLSRRQVQIVLYSAKENMKKCLFGKGFRWIEH